MKIDIPKKVSFHAPEGAHRATLLSVGEPKRGSDSCDNEVRLVWELQTVDRHWTFHAGKTYCLDDNSIELIADLESLLGEEMHLLQDESGQLDLDLLIGRQADLILVHINNSKHDKPYVYIKGVCPPGTHLPLV